MRVLSLCSGYGGLELALSQSLPDQDWDLIAVCDNYGPARTVLSGHWPESDQFKDVHDPALDDVEADVVTFGFPCQDLSRAGHGAGLRGSRSGLFFRCAEVGHLSGAEVLIIENVPQALKYRAAIDSELGRYGFAVRWSRAEAWEVGARHRRARVFLTAVRGAGKASWLIQSGRRPPRSAPPIYFPPLPSWTWVGAVRPSPGSPGERLSALSTATGTGTGSPCTRPSAAPSLRRLPERWRG